MTKTKELSAAIDQIDDVLHQKARLGIMASLVAAGELDFGSLKRNLELTDGNLSAHLATLEKHGLILITKEFVRRKPHTSVVPTEKGRYAFERYLAALEQLVSSARGTSGGVDR